MEFNENEFNWDIVWQVGCGDFNRDFRDVFFDYGMLVIGASDDLGPHDENIRPYNTRDDWGDASDKIWPVAVGMEIGDTIILKNGKKIVGVGKITSEYMYDAYSDWKIDSLKNLRKDQKKTQKLIFPIL